MCIQRHIFSFNFLLMGTLRYFKSREDGVLHAHEPVTHLQHFSSQLILPHRSALSRMAVTGAVVVKHLNCGQAKWRRAPSVKCYVTAIFRHFPPPSGAPQRILPWPSYLNIPFPNPVLCKLLVCLFFNTFMTCSYLIISLAQWVLVRLLTMT